jgi:hypothetical protein
MHQKQSCQDLIGFSFYEKSAGHRHRQLFYFWKKPVEKCTRSFQRCNVNRGKVTSWRILVSSPAAPSIITQVPHGRRTLSHSPGQSPNERLSFICSVYFRFKIKLIPLPQIGKCIVVTTQIGNPWRCLESEPRAGSSKTWFSMALNLCSRWSTGFHGVMEITRRLVSFWTTGPGSDFFFVPNQY